MLSEARKSCGSRHAAGLGSAFTLIELLVVIAVIALLLTILAPAVMRAKLLARRATCASNLHSIGVAGGLYQGDNGDYLPIAWENLPATAPYVHPWQTWRASLLRYVGYAAFNCPSAIDSGVMGQVFHSPDEVRSLDLVGTANAGSYGVLYQWSLPGFQTPTYSGPIAQGHPNVSQAFSVQPGVAWKNPSNSVYVADACLTKSPISYPTQPYKDYGTSVIYLPTRAGYFDDGVSRRFADRHVGTNCLFVGGQVVNYETRRLDAMTDDSPDCVWNPQPQ